ncbi:MAG: UDP-N-acetylglucosamine--N-acetylmuramyl-(pentapeptide) pyrophosphoryl-undecaprenol N-acetylglucosamine transferase [Gemmatimonadaceae bacterium]
MRVIVAGGGTGGHLYPGLAIARALVARDPAVEPFFVGARRGIERDVLPASGFPFALLDLHPLYRARPWENWRTLRGAAGAWRRMSAIGRAGSPPALVIGTGGYAAGVALAYASAHRIPLVLQEQNSFPGLTVRFFSRFARQIFLGFPEAETLLSAGPAAEIVHSGNPIEPPDRGRSRAAARLQWGFDVDADSRVLLVFGGSQGARVLNEVVRGWIEKGLPPRLRIIWATGRSEFKRFAALESDRVRVRPYLSPIADAYAAADLAMTRAGAMTTAELCAWGIAAILVPLPTAAADHQTANAVALERAGAAIHLPQRGLDAVELESRVRVLVEAPAALERLAAGALARGRPDAAENIARRILMLARQLPRPATS